MTLKTLQISGNRLIAMALGGFLLLGAYAANAVSSKHTALSTDRAYDQALLAPDGSVTFRADARQSTARLAAVPIQKGLTFYVRFGNWLGFMALILSLVLVLWRLFFVGWRSWQSLDTANQHVEALPG